MLTFITGLPATGKTTLAEALARKTNALHYNSDKVRGALELYGQYSPQAIDTVYEHLLEGTEAALNRGRSVIVDATFSEQSWRDRFEKLAEKYGTVCYWVYLETAPENIYLRMQHKRKYSEADYRKYEEMKSEFDAFERPHLVLYSDTHTVDKLAESVVKYVQNPSWGRKDVQNRIY